MGVEDSVQLALEAIDDRIKEEITPSELAGLANYSIYHFCRIFGSLVGTPVMAYVTRRKLEFALYDLSLGRKVIDVAMDYGFGTHAGFTKAFKKCFGYPPSLYHLHVNALPPGKPALGNIQLRTGGMKHMHVSIMEKESFLVVGFESRHTMPQVKRVGDIPAFWDTLSMEYGPLLSRLHHTFTQSEHCEYSVCYNVDENTGAFSWMLGVGVDNQEDKSKIEADMCQKVIPGGLYAVFSTPKVPEKEYPQSIAAAWREILTKWLPDSEYEYDESRPDFERYDERDHAWLHGGTCQMEVAIPVRLRH